VDPTASISSMKTMHGACEVKNRFAYSEDETRITV
jgi:hypothetical protein